MRQTKRFIGILVVVAMMYLAGLVAVTVRFGNVRLPDWRKWIGDVGVLGDDAPSDTAFDAGRTAKTGRPRAEKRKRVLREEPIQDNLPEMVRPDVPMAPESEELADVSATEAAPGPVPGGVTIPGGIRTERCWDNKGFELDGERCDALPEFDKRFYDRVYLADGCRQDTLGPLHTGTVAVIMELDFVRRTMSIWEGPGSTMHRAKQVVSCFKDRLGAMWLGGGPHRHSRYQVSADIVFGRPTRVVAPGAEVVAPSAAPLLPDAAALKEALSDAVEVSVVKDRVRVRKAPVDGEIIGFVNPPQKVRLVEQEGDWCLVKTKRGNVGWMVCWGLETR